MSNEENDQLDIEDEVIRILNAIGEDPEREGLLKTPARVARSMKYLCGGYEQNVESIINQAIFHEDHQEMVLVSDIDFYSLCEHHMLPFFGKCHVAYIPNGSIIGLSKIPRIVEVFARRLQVQERMTDEIARALMEYLEPQGVAVVTEARHLCMMMRGIQKQNTIVKASALHGVFRNDQKTREEFMTLISSPRR